MRYSCPMARRVEPGPSRPRHAAAGHGSGRAAERAAHRSPPLVGNGGRRAPSQPRRRRSTDLDGRLRPSSSMASRRPGRGGVHRRLGRVRDERANAAGPGALRAAPPGLPRGGARRRAREPARRSRARRCRGTPSTLRASRSSGRSSRRSTGAPITQTPSSGRRVARARVAPRRGAPRAARHAPHPGAARAQDELAAAGRGRVASGGLHVAERLEDGACGHGVDDARSPVDAPRGPAHRGQALRDRALALPHARRRRDERARQHGHRARLHRPLRRGARERPGGHHHRRRDRRGMAARGCLRRARDRRDRVRPRRGRAQGDRRGARRPRRSRAAHAPLPARRAPHVGRRRRRRRRSSGSRRRTSSGQSSRRSTRSTSRIWSG